MPEPRRLPHRFALLNFGASQATRRLLAVIQIAVLLFSLAVPAGTAFAADPSASPTESGRAAFARYLASLERIIKAAKR